MPYEFDYAFLRSGTPMITLWKHGIALNEGADRMLGMPEYVAIGYDQKAGAIAVRPKKPQDTAAYPFTSRFRDGWVRIGAREFMRLISVRHAINCTEKSVRVIPDFVQKENMLIVNIRNAG